MALAHLLGIAMILWGARVRGEKLGPYLDTLFAVVLAGTLGARFAYVALHPEEFPSTASLFHVSHGGFSFFGGLALAFPAYWATLRWHRLPVLRTSDSVSPILPFCLSIARVGCFLEGCCYGVSCEAPWSINKMHPTQLYEAFFLLLVALLMMRARRWKMVPGLLATSFIFSYALYRFGADFLRGDLERGFLGISWLAPTQAAAVVCMAAAMIAWRIAKRA